MNISVDSKLKEILANPEARAIVEELRPRFSANPMIKLAMGMKFSDLIKYPQAGYSPEEIQLLTEKLNALGRKEPSAGAAAAENRKNLDFGSVSGKVVIVTGASRGIGEAIARCYADHGMKVVCANRDPVKGLQVVDSIKATGGDALYFKTDASKPAEIKAPVDFAVNSYGRLDGIVNNSGIGMGGTPLMELYLVYRELGAFLDHRGIQIGRQLVGNYITSLDMQGFSLTLLKLDARRKALWDFPVHTPALRWGR